MLEIAKRDSLLEVYKIMEKISRFTSEMFAPAELTNRAAGLASPSVLVPVKRVTHEEFPLDQLAKIQKFQLQINDKKERRIHTSLRSKCLELQYVFRRFAVLPMPSAGALRAVG